MGRSERRRRERDYRAYQKTHPFNSITSFVVTVIVAYFIGLPLLFAMFTAVFGSPGEILTNMIDLIPFGGVYCNLAIQFINAMTNQIITLLPIQISAGYILGELAKSFFTIIAFEFLNGIVFLATGLDEPYGFWDNLKCALIMAVDALIAACLAPFLMDYILDQMKQLGTVGFALVSLLLVVLLVGGGIAFIFFKEGQGLLNSVLYVLVKFVLMGACRISVSYISLMLIVVGWATGAYHMMLSGVAGLLGIGLMLSGLELMISGAMK